MAEPQHKIGDVVIADKIGGDKSISAIREILITKDGKIFYFLANPSVGYAEENIRLADSQLNQYDRLFTNQEKIKANCWLISEQSQKFLQIRIQSLAAGCFAIGAVSCLAIFKE